MELESKWNTRNPRTQAAELEGWPERILEDSRPGNTLNALFTVLDPEKGSQSTKDVLFFLLLLFFFNGTTFRLLSKVSSGSLS